MGMYLMEFPPNKRFYKCIERDKEDAFYLFDNMTPTTFDLYILIQGSEKFPENL